MLILILCISTYYFPDAVLNILHALFTVNLYNNPEIQILLSSSHCWGGLRLERLHKLSDITCESVAEWDWNSCGSNSHSRLLTAVMYLPPPEEEKLPQGQHPLSPQKLQVHISTSCPLELITAQIRNPHGILLRAVLSFFSFLCTPNRDLQMAGVIIFLFAVYSPCTSFPFYGWESAS